ncbi:MAG: RecX family transcriptional regulator, partial [Ignavibacteria bacterium]|nr:RecX family transcriptional regulator [Ignavibacteria bacterium]
MRITRIEAQKRRPGRKSIFLDGAFAIGISDETLLRSGLRTGDSLEPEALKELQDLEEVSDARTSALRLLGRRPRSTKELTDRLRRKQYR